MAKNNDSIIDIFQNNELKISVLYRIYSRKLRSHKGFWEKLSDEEVEHAKKISGINNKEFKDSFQETKFSRGIISYVNDFVDEQIKKARMRKVSHLEALNISLRIEQSLLEKKCFEIFIPTDKKIRSVAERLNKDTKEHERLLRKELEREEKKIKLQAQP